jgi:serine carboxypeptidase-like clade 2
VVRISAGPACSSLLSWLYSKGPFVFVPYTAELRLNHNNWNKQANLLFIEGPAGVGYSVDKSGMKRNISDD